METINTENINPETEIIDGDLDIITDALTGIDAVLIALQSLKARAIMNTFSSQIGKEGEEQRRVNRVKYDFFRNLEERIQKNKRKTK